MHLGLGCGEVLTKLVTGNDQFSSLVSHLLLHQFFISEIAEAEPQAWVISRGSLIVTKRLVRMLDH
jgi:hypothetical protein